jgi:hypothetical protein
MKKTIICTGSLLALTVSLCLFYRSRRALTFQRVKILEKSTILHLFQCIRAVYTDKFAVTLRLNRKKRRSVHRGGREYRSLVLELKEQAKDALQRCIEEVLQKNGLKEDFLAASYKFYDNDPEIRTALSKLCILECRKKVELSDSRIEMLLEAYTARTEEFVDGDEREINVQMKILEDDLFDEFGVETEEVEEAKRKVKKGRESLVKMVEEVNEALLEKTNQELFY